MAVKPVEGFQFGAHGEAPFVWINPGDDGNVPRIVNMVVDERLTMRINVVPNAHRDDKFLVVVMCGQIPVSGPYSSNMGRGHLLHVPTTGNICIDHYRDDKGKWVNDITCGPEEHHLVYKGTVVEIKIYAVINQGIADEKSVIVNTEPVASVCYLIEVVNLHVRDQPKTFS